MAHVLVAGATGYLGTYMLKNLIKRKVKTTAVVRNISKLENRKSSINVLKANYSDKKALKNCGEGIDVVISSLGITRQNDGLSYMDVDYQAKWFFLRYDRFY